MTEPDVDGVEDALALVGRPSREPAHRGGSRSPATDPAHASSHASEHGETPWARARDIAARAGRGTPAGTVRTPLSTALGRVLAEPLTALTDLPSFDTSAMDGWAVAGPGPWEVLTADSLLAGRGEAPVLPDGAAVRIATGARVPPDTTAVLRSEHARTDADGRHVHALRELVPGQDIRPRGQECRAGEPLLPAATVVTPAVLGLAAAAGYDAVTTLDRPRVEILVLGDELLASGVPHEGSSATRSGRCWLRGSRPSVSTSWVPAASATTQRRCTRRWTGPPPSW